MNSEIVMRTHFFVIDDEEEEVRLINAALHHIKADHKCTWAKTEGQALAQLQYLTPDVIFFDFNIGGFDGLHRIMNMPNCYGVPVILYSSCLSGDVRRQALESGVYDCIPKPRVLEDLMLYLKTIPVQKLVYK